MTVSVEFTEFLLPNGRRRQTSITVAAALAPLVRELLTAGYRFEAEILRNGLVHFDVCDEEAPLANTITENGPPVQAAVETLIREAHAAWVERGRPEAVIVDREAPR